MFRDHLLKNERESDGRKPQFWLVSFSKHLNIGRRTGNQQQYSQGCPKVDIEEQGARMVPSIYTVIYIYHEK